MDCEPFYGGTYTVYDTECEEDGHTCIELRGARLAQQIVGLQKLIEERCWYSDVCELCLRHESEHANGRCLTMPGKFSNPGPEI